MFTCRSLLELLPRGYTSKCYLNVFIHILVVRIGSCDVGCLQALESKFICMMALTSKQQKLALSLIILREIKNLLEEKNKRKVIRRRWVKPLLLRRVDHDIEAHLLKDLALEDDDRDFRNFTRIHVHMFDTLLGKMQNRLEKQDTVMRNSITPRVKLAITLRYIATGDSYKSLEFMSRVSRSTISAFVPEVLQAIYDSLSSEHLKMPDTECKWQKIAEDFERVWQFPHTLGALDGKHIRINAPPHTGSQFYNFKGYFSIVLFAAVDAHCRFTYINVGSNGKSSDNTIFSDSYLYEALYNGNLNIPPPKQLIPNKGNKIPYYFIGDDAFMLDRHIMKPYSRSMKLSVPQEVFNYRLCRARMVVECAFGRLASRFRIFHRPIEVKIDTVDAIVKACCALHNYLTKPKSPTTPQEDPAHEIIDAFSAIGKQTQKTYKYACRTRDELSRFLTTDGSVDFQWKKIHLNN